MRIISFFKLLFIALTCVTHLVYADPLTVVGIAGVLGVAFVGKKLYCYVGECCTEKWTVHNVTGIGSSLREQVFGQHLVIQVVSKAIAGHATNPNPSKALVLSFHGWTGSGKNFVSNIIAEHLYSKGCNSKYVHKIISSHAFPIEEDIETYKIQLKTWIVGNVSRCGRALFIIDEMDKMPPGLADVLKPFLDYHDRVDGVDFRKSIFILLSNTAGDVINDEMFSHWKTGRKREEVTIKQMDKLLNIATYSIEGGLWKSKLTEHHLIDFFIPFLPLEKKHVKMCIETELKKQKKPIIKDIVGMIANELDYFPSKEQLFSTSGCKKVEKRVQVLA